MKREPELSEIEQFLYLIVGYRPAMSINIVANLGVADEIGEQPKPVDEIAKAVGANSTALYRVMRALTTVGVFQEAEGRMFTHTSLSKMLRRDNPDSLRNIALWMPDPFHFRCNAELMHSVRTGEPAVQATFGKPMFQYVRDDPEEAAVFNAAMATITGLFIPSVLEAYDFSGIRNLVDVGGGIGSVLAGILRAYPEIKGILYDLPHVVNRAGPTLEAAGVADRCEIVSGDFFKSVPSGDAYILKHVIHDWTDDECRVILGHIRQALTKESGGRLLLLEWVISPGPAWQFAKWTDLEMLALPGGQERTEQEYRDLLASAGFKLTRFLPTRSLASVIEAHPM
jgi:hypothetical protein